MASVSTDKKNGRKTVYFHNGEVRKAIRLGLVTQKQAEEIARRIDSIISSQNSGLSLDPTTATWLGQIDETLEDKLIAAGLLQKRPAAESPKSLAELVAYCLGEYEHGKSNTLRNIKRAADLVLERFGGDTLLEQIKKGDAADFRRQLSRDGFSDTTVTAHCKKARRLFNMAIDKGWIATNPFNGMKNWTDTNESRMFFVSREVTQRIIDACEPEWQLIVALVRYGGLRCPSEVLDLRWEWINLPESRMSIFSSKNEHHAKKRFRVCPIFPELRPYLEAAWDRNESAELVIQGHREGSHAAVYNAFKKRVVRANVPIWPKLFVNLRSSRETELVEEFPIHVVTSWLGNSPTIAKAHYLQVTDAHFDRAISSIKEVEKIVALR